MSRASWGRTPFSPEAWRRRLRVSQRAEPADLLITHGKVVNVFSGELLRQNIAIADGVIAAVGDYTEAAATIDATGMIVAPSFVDGHIHLESSLLWPPEFARAVVPHGTGAVVTDPHEMANVCGLAGIEAMRSATANLPLHVAFTAPSCVPASEHESPGATFGVDEIAAMLAWPETVGLGELMNFPGVFAGDGEIADKLAAATGVRRDGHAPGLRGDAIQAYAGSGIDADHESTSAEEAREKLRAGLMVMLREGTSEKNLREILPLVTDETWPRCCFASDDRDCHDLLHQGHVDDILRIAIGAGLDPIRGIQMATRNTAHHWRLDGIGAIAPGYQANLVLLADLRTVNVRATLFQGEVVARDGEYLADVSTPPVPATLLQTVNLGPVRLSDLRLAPEHAHHAVELIPGQIVTRCRTVEPAIENGWAVSDVSRDLLKLVCVERHHATGRVGVGYVHGFGLRRGALASTIAHDAHNIIAVGASDADILGAIATVAESHGGLAAVTNGQVLAHLPLPIAGLLSDQPLGTVAAGYDEQERAGHTLGSPLASPFGQLAFLALSVIPEARVTDRGFLTVGV
jgi:adenine deaminase